MIEIIQKYEDLFRFLEDLRRLKDKGMTRFNLHGFQKHGEETLDVPGDGGHYDLNEMIWRVDEALDLTLRYLLKFEKLKSEEIRNENTNIN